MIWGLGFFFLKAGLTRHFQTFLAFGEKKFILKLNLCGIYIFFYIHLNILFNSNRKITY